MFDLRVFQRSSDIFQELGLLRHLVGGVLQKEKNCEAPIPGDSKNGKNNNLYP